MAIYLLVAAYAYRMCESGSFTRLEKPGLWEDALALERQAASLRYKSPDSSDARGQSLADPVRRLEPQG